MRHFLQKLIIVFGIIFPVILYAASPKELFEAANEAYVQGQYERALNLFEQMISYYPAFAPAYNAIGVVYITMDKPEEAVYYFKRAADLEPKKAQAFDSLGKAYYAAKDFENAEVAFQKALELDPNLKSVHFSLGWVYLLGKPKPTKAIYYFKKILETNPTMTAAIYGIGLGYLSDKNRIKVMEIITQLRDMKNDDLAKQLEAMLRENRYELVPPDLSPSKPAISNDPSYEPDYSKPSGIPVRLRGKLERRE